MCALSYAHLHCAELGFPIRHTNTVTLINAKVIITRTEGTDGSISERYELKNEAGVSKNIKRYCMN